MLSTVSLIDPTTLNPSFSDSSRIGRPAVIVTRGDQQTAVDQFQQLLTNAKAYRLQMLTLSKAAANFGYSLEKIAHSKTAIMDPSNVGNSDTVYKQFEIPLLQHLDTHKANIEASEAQYERSMRDMSQKIKETEAASLQNGRKRQRDLLQFRQALTTLTMQVDELERIKLGYYFSNLESEQANLQLILQKTSTIVRAEVDIYERIANKGLNDLILEPMTTQGPDPYCTYPTTDEFSSIFSILPQTPIIPTGGPGAASTNATSTPQPEGMSNFYGYHEVNPFSTARTQATAANRHLFGEASSVESKESMLTKPAIPTTTAAAAAVVSTKDKSSTHHVVEANALSNTKEQMDAPKEHGSPKPGQTKTPDSAVKSSSIHENTTLESNEESTVVADTERASMDFFRSTSVTTQREPSAETESSPPQSSSSTSQGVNLRTGQQHHRNSQSHHHTKHIDDSPGPASSSSEPSSSVPSYTLHRSRSGSRSHLMMDSPPIRTGIHIGQDSELLNNRDFSFSYEPSELLENRHHHHHLQHSLHHSHTRDFHGFDELEEDDHQDMHGFRSSSPKPILHDEPEQEVSKSIGPEQQQQQVYLNQAQPPLHELRHSPSQGQLSRSSSTNLSILGSSTGGSNSGSGGSSRQNGIISGIATSILRSSTRIRSSAASSFGHSYDDDNEDDDGNDNNSYHGGTMDHESSFSFGNTNNTTTATTTTTTTTTTKQQQNMEEVADHIRELGRGFDEGIPAFTEDDDEPTDFSAKVRHGGFSSQEREHGAFMIGALETSAGYGQESNSSEDLRKLESEGSAAGAVRPGSSRAASVLGTKSSSESIRMADGSCKDVLKG
ncbi:hypothetical protein BG004_007765 [Podila humilis]|nr:hypothetical protein BG004_007765 [Podila humilis]